MHRKRDSAPDLLGTLVLCLLAVAACAAAAIYADVVPAQLHLGTPLLFERLCILLGLLVAIAAQAIGCILVFRRSFLQGGLSLFLPGYIFFALERAGLYRPVIGTWCLGVLSIVTGTVMLA